jgi:predicted CoA-substrate-specific enzyme activase
MTYYLGIDIGSGTSKGILTQGDKIISCRKMASGMDYRLAAQQLRDDLLAGAALSEKDIARTVTTGHGDGVISFSNQHIADMRCCARGMIRTFPSVRTIIDVQGQNSQVIRLNEKGKVINFAISEVCASAGGIFLEIIANVLQVDLKDMGALSLKSKNPVVFTTGCAVFGESEAISRVAEGIPKEDIVAGVHRALATKIITLVERVGLIESCAISGGGAFNIGLVKNLEDLGLHLLVPPNPEFTNAIGAAIMAEEFFTLKR